MPKHKHHSLPTRSHSKSLAQLFSDTYIVARPDCAYILLPALLTDPALAKNPQSLLSPSARPTCLTRYDGTPAFRIRSKFHRALLSFANNSKAIFNHLNFIFNEQAIKRLFPFPNIWLLNHNAQARRRRLTEMSAINHLRKSDPAAFALHAQCLSRTRNTSVSYAARTNRSLALPS